MENKKYYLINADDADGLSDYEDGKLGIDGTVPAIELTQKQLLDLSYGVIPFDVIEVIVEGLKKDNNE